MNPQEAKQILMLYRPGTADAQDPSFAEALKFCETNPELQQWFEQHCATYAAMRAKFKQIAVPEGLKEQILAERKAQTAVSPKLSPSAGPKKFVRLGLYATACAAVVAIAFLAFWFPARGPHSFYAYSKEMLHYGMRPYGMDVKTNDLNQVRTYLGSKSAVADFKLPAGLEQNAELAGCVAMKWQGRTVSMVCFKTGRPLQGNAQADLWLFVIDRSEIFREPNTPEPQIAQTDRTASATWTAEGKTYILAVRGDEQLLRKFL